MKQGIVTMHCGRKGLSRQGTTYVMTGRVLGLLIFSLFFAGCGEPEDAAKDFPPIAIEAGDECHVCGMSITNFPGPKGEAYLRGKKFPLKFCSTRDLFSYLLQPENQGNVSQIYVHDMGATDWTHPADSAFVDARTAWFVAEQPLKGAMGPTLASFKNREDAMAFVERHGGEVLRFNEITLEILANLTRGTAEKEPGH